MKHRDARDRARQRIYREVRAARVRASGGHKQLELELAKAGNLLARVTRKREFGRANVCPECGRWGYHLATCSLKGPHL